MNRVIFTLLFVIIFSTAHSQNSSCTCFVKGVVRDQHSGLPIVGATILLVGQNNGVFTDEQVRYQISNLCPGAYEME